MEPNIVALQPDGRWPQDRLDLAPVRDQRKRRRGVLMLGAGFSKAVNPKSLIWTELLNDVAARMKATISGKDPRADALLLSWRGSRRPTSAVESEFQRATAAAVKDRTGDIENRGPLTAVAEFLRTTGCDVIIDLNYDKMAETMLTEAGMPYYRVVGVQMDVRPPLPDGMILLWKIHGSMDYPPTIVLSPLEYQRKYEVNDLGAELVRLGKDTHLVWSVGVGLLDDDVWTFLTLNAEDLEIVAIHLDREAAAGNPAALKAWGDALGPGVARATVLSATLPKEPTDELQRCVEQLTTLLKPAVPPSAEPLAVAEDIARFDDRFHTARSYGYEPAVQAVVGEFADRHENLVHYLLTPRHNRVHRWLPFFECGDIRIDHELRKKAGMQLMEILKSTRDFVEKFTHRQRHSGLLVVAAGQSVVRNVFEWLEAFGVDHTIELEALGENPAVQRKNTMLLGANPFDAAVRSGNSDAFNAMQLFTPAETLRLHYPLIGKNKMAPPGTPLLDENHWEAAVISMFHARRPQLRIADELFDLGWTWPVYPWGFGRKSIASYRESSPGTITQSWHLVSNRKDGRQMCKGGSLRDRGETMFMVARRGWVRIGEYDDFVQSSV